MSEGNECMLELMDSKLSHYSPFRKKNHA